LKDGACIAYLSARSNFNHSGTFMATALILVGSPRRSGNSALLADAVRLGVEASGMTAKLRHLDDHISHFLRDCRSCRRPDGECSIEDGYRDLFFNDFLPAEAVVFCTPIYWYGMSAQTKAFFDRSFCYYASSYPASADVVQRMQAKRLGLVLASEETYPGAELGIVHQIQEFARYTRSQFVGCVRGVGNSRGEAAKDPGDPLAAAKRLGAEVFSRPYSDYHLDTPRSPRVWE
jgi:multimeric flavodoxin WrbA